jgi:plastocyanin
MTRVALIAAAAALPALSPVPAGGAAEGTDPVVISVAPSEFATREVIVPQGSSATLHQLDRLANHDVLSEDRANGEYLFFTQRVLGFGQSAPILGVEKLQLGEYAFTCSVHPEMYGKLTVTKLARVRPQA